MTKRCEGVVQVKNDHILRDALSVTLSEFYRFIEYEIHGKIHIVVQHNILIC